MELVWTAIIFIKRNPEKTFDLIVGIDIIISSKSGGSALRLVDWGRGLDLSPFNNERNK